MLIAIDLTSGEGVAESGARRDADQQGGIENGRVWLEQGGKQRLFDPVSGREEPVTQ